ncbi:MAG: M48 family metalloprotease [Nitrospinae bacterium]|nr:M48 family metalloprotease [Nitrospinota bacterium]
MPADPPLDRRRFLRGTVALWAVGIAGCASNPVSGRGELMLVTPDEERELDRLRAPIQLSADYGAIDDPALVAYVGAVGAAVASTSQRRDLPWSFTPVDALYVNAYAFPAGSVGVTRGMLLELSSEAELAALLGHETGHVNARHAAARMSAGRVARMVVEGAAGLLEVIVPGADDLTDMAYGLGGLGAGLLLARYSREDERQADALGIAYMTAAGYPATGMVDLLGRLRDTSGARPDLVTTLFATHPMSDERYARARREAKRYPSKEPPLHLRERYMEATALLRRRRGAIVEGQKGERALREGRFDDAAIHFALGIRRAPDDYALHLLSARLTLAQKRPAEAIPLAEGAMAIKPGEPQAWQVRGRARYALREYDEALADFARHTEALSGEGSSLFMQGICHERMGDKEAAAAVWRRYLSLDRSSRLADYAARRLEDYGEE